MIPELSYDISFVVVLMLLGLWLETIGGRNGFWDGFFTPFPLGLSGTTLVLLEWLVA